ncbi:MAG TPA: insulinase family protein, partial [Saprospiraceae bacterium]|nr:insulinase family protein [Saprospiraceae bacterium]
MNKLLSLLLIIVIQQSHVNAQKTPYFQKFKLDNQLKVAFTQSDKQETVIEIYESLKVDNETRLPGLKSVVFNCIMAIIQEDQEIASLIKARKCSTSVKDNKLYFRFPKRYTEHFLQIIAQTFKNPKFEDNTLQKVIQQQLSLLENDCQNPQKNAFYTQQIVNFKNYPYGKVTSPTSLQRIRLKNVINYCEQNFSAPTTRLIIIGSPPLGKIKKWNQQYFGDWKEKNFYRKYTKKSKAPKKRSIHYAKNKNESEAAIIISHPIRLRPFGLYQHAASLLSFIYQQQLADQFEDEKINAHFELKPDNNLGIFTAGLELPADQLPEVLPVFLSWINTISQQKIQDSTFQSYKRAWIKQLSKYKNSIEGQLSYAHHFLLLNNAKPFYEDADIIRNIQPSDITAAGNMFIQPKQSYLIIAAPPSHQKSIQTLFPDEEIHLHDCRGREIQGVMNSSKKISLNTILEKYLDTIGCIKQLEAIHSITYTQTSHYAKSIIQKNYQKKAPNKLVVHQFFNQILTKEIKYDG